MKKILALLLALALLPACLTCAAAESFGPVEDFDEVLWEDIGDDAEEGGEGTIEIADPAELAMLGAPDLSIGTEPTDGYFPEIVEKHIIGKDTRTTVKKANKYPYSAICMIQATLPCKCRGLQGTGFMIGKNKVLTAAHCLICQKHNVRVKKLTLYFGYRKGKGSVYRYNGKWKAHCGTGFPGGYQNHDLNDWAVIKLKQNVGKKTGYFGHWCMTDKQINNSKFYIAGYRDNKLKRDKGSASVIDAKRMWVNIDVLPGNSGSPIYCKFKGKYYAVGIWTTYWDNGRNSGVRLTKSIMDYVKKY